MGDMRVLTVADTPSVTRLLDSRPVDYVSLNFRLQRQGIAGFGNRLWGWFDHTRLVSCLSDGFTLTPVAAGHDALRGFAHRVERRHATSIVGPRNETMELWDDLCNLSFAQWSEPREVRDHQLVMVLDTPVAVAPYPPVLPVTTTLLEPYFKAAVAMYTEEIGVAPMDTISYHGYVADLIMRGAAYGLVVDNHVVFKADVVATAGKVAQIGGVWLAPNWRTQGWSEPLMAAVAADVRRRWPIVTLYVNPWNTPAIRCYTHVGFRQVSECATILY